MIRIQIWFNWLRPMDIQNIARSFLQSNFPCRQVGSNICWIRVSFVAQERQRPEAPAPNISFGDFSHFSRHAVLPSLCGDLLGMDGFPFSAGMQQRQRRPRDLEWRQHHGHGDQHRHGHGDHHCHHHRHHHRRLMGVRGPSTRRPCNVRLCGR